MNILIDINHPAHVHYFRNFILEAEKKGHKCVVTNRRSNLIIELLDSYKIKHITRSARPDKNSLLFSLYYLLKMVAKIYTVSRKNKIDFYLGFASAPCSIVSFLRRKPCVVLDDTEHNEINQLIYLKFCNSVITPFYFEKDLGKKQVIINAFIEQLYLHSSNFTPAKANNKENYILLRFIAYDARHDSKVPNKLREKDKIELVKKLINLNHNVLISVEGQNKVEYFEPYLLKSKVIDIHNIIANAEFFISEGATMASEAGILGTSYFYANPLQVGYINYQCEHFDHANQGSKQDLFKMIDRLKTKKSKGSTDKIEQSTIDPTKFLVWFVLNYPKSKNQVGDKMVDKMFLETNNLIHDE